LANLKDAGGGAWLHRFKSWHNNGGSSPTIRIA
jgi:hypothetical protein